MIGWLKLRFGIDVMGKVRVLVRAVNPRRSNELSDSLAINMRLLPRTRTWTEYVQNLAETIDAPPTIDGVLLRLDESEGKSWCSS